MIKINKECFVSTFAPGDYSHCRIFDVLQRNNDTFVIQNYCLRMPVIDTKNFNSIYDSVSSRLSTSDERSTRKKEVGIYVYEI